MKKISIHNLTIAYDELVVLENFTAEFDTGIHWIQGHNGSGKSSLLKSLCGIKPVNRNRVKIMGHDLVNCALKAKSQLCFVADKPEVYPFMTGLQFLKMIAKIKGVKLTNELFSFMDAINLSQFNETEFSKMSFGTRRKFTLCMVFIGNPHVVLLDEPFNGLDKNTIKHFSNWLAEARKTKCLMVVSHVKHLLDSLHDSILELK
ncbi:MAG: ATP-binding cassette domain-containing protein [Proteobacteria bacterium]|nr:ATP-binding cassette domain-containing protein [Pseudomonadota bacterium]